MYGYGKILDVDLTTGEIIKRDTGLQFAQEFLVELGLHDIASELLEQRTKL